MRYGTLTDENGKVYEFKFDPENTEGVNSRQFMRGPALDPGTRQVTFEAGNALLYQVASPVTILVDTYQNAGLREGVIFPQAEASANGIKVSVPYGYFGDDFTGLWVEIDTNAYAALPKGGSLRIRPNSALMGRSFRGNLNFENTPNKDKWKVYNLKHSLVTDQLYQPGEQIPVHILSQLNRATAQTLRINGFTIDMDLPASPAPLPQTVVTLPIAELSETETKEVVSYLVEYEGYQAEIVSVQAHLNQSELGDYVILAFEHKPFASPANIRLNGFHFKIRNGMGDKDAYSYKTKDFGASHPLLPRRSHIRFKYDPNQTEIKLEISGLNYDLINPMEITIPPS